MTGSSATRPEQAAAGPLLLRARWLLPVAGRPIEDAWLRIDHGRVTGLGRWPASGGRLGRSIDLGDAIITPGFVNAHTHLEFSECREPIDPTGGLPAWIGRVVAWRRAQSCPPQQQETVVRQGLIESAADGVVAVGEIGTSPISSNCLQHGPRTRVFRELLGLRSGEPGGPPAPVAAALRDAERLANAGVAVGLSPHAPYSTHRRLGRVTLAAASRLRQVHRRATGFGRGLIPLTMHLAESQEENRLLLQQTGPFRELFEQLGVWPDQPPLLATTADWISLLARADRGLVVHGTFLPDDPVALARLSRQRQRLAVVVCPRTTQALAGRLPPVAALRAAGVRVCLGTDGRGSNPDLSIRAEGRCLIGAGLVSPAEALRMVTMNGAWAIGFEHCTGRLTVGRPADLAMLRPATAPDSVAAATSAIFAADTEVVATLRGGRCIAGELHQTGN